MGKLIIDATSGTVLDADNCYVVEDSVLTEDDYSDSELCEIAKTGKSVAEMGRDTGWGDNAYRHTVSYSPLSLRDEARVYIDGGIYVEGDPEWDALNWAENATADELSEVSDHIMAYDGVWDDFRANFIECLIDVYNRNKK
jgi:hypothetical protein